MNILRPTKLVRLLLAATVLAGSVASSPTFGHAHPLPDSIAHDHHDAELIGHFHSPHHHDGLAETDGHDAGVLGSAVFHVHGVWFGIPFSLPALTGQPDGRPNAHPMADACLTPAASSQSGGIGSVSSHSNCPNGHGLPPPHGTATEITNNSVLCMPTRHSAGSHCAVTARSGVLRC